MNELNQEAEFTDQEVQEQAEVSIDQEMEKQVAESSYQEAQEQAAGPGNQNIQEFTPRIISSPDMPLQEKIRGLYGQLTNMAQCLAWEFENHALKENPLKLDEWFDVLRIPIDELPEYLKSVFVKVNKIVIPGIKTAKLVQTDLLDLPESFETILEIRRNIVNLIEEIAPTRFCYPLRNLYDDEIHQFKLNADFEKQLHTFTSVYTESELQNKVLDKIERFSDLLNEMAELKIIKLQGNQWQNVGNILSSAIITDKLNNRLKPNPIMFRTWPLKSFGNYKFVPLERNKSQILS
jgi:hypothetical protein